MKVPASIRRAYDAQKATNDSLKKKIDRLILGFKNSRWHYESRVKELVSFALKIESGRVEDPMALEDFFACTVVVANASELRQAEDLICSNFALRERRPGTKLIANAPETFSFDDLRLYVMVRDDAAVPPTDLSGIVFEVQIKTFLQHAWVIATHDLVYKSDEVDWGKQRIAYEIRAMLELAEVSIQEAGKLATSKLLAKTDQQTEMIKVGINLLKSHWDQDELPSDMRRLSENIIALLTLLELDVSRLETILDANRASRGGYHLANLSPYGTIVQYLFEAEQDRMQKVLTVDGVSTRVLIPSEIKLPTTAAVATLRNAVLVN